MIDADSSVNEAERRVVLEIAILTVVADDEIHPDERAALDTMAAALGVEIPPVRRISRETVDGRLLELARLLTTPASRALAYRAACIMAQADRSASDGEFEFDLQLIDALNLDQAEADRIAAEVTSSAS